MQTQELIEQASEYTQTVIDNGFALGTGILMVLVLVIGGVAFFRYVTLTINKRLDNIKDIIKELIKFNTLEHKDILNKVNDTENQLSLEIGRIQEKQASIVAAVNIIVKKNLNGSEHKE